MKASGNSSCGARHSKTGNPAKRGAICRQTCAYCLNGALANVPMPSNSSAIVKSPPDASKYPDATFIKKKGPGEAWPPEQRTTDRGQRLPAAGGVRRDLLRRFRLLVALLQMLVHLQARDAL